MINRHLRIHLLILLGILLSSIGAVNSESFPLKLAFDSPGAIRLGPREKHSLSLHVENNSEVSVKALIAADAESLQRVRVGINAQEPAIISTMEIELPAKSTRTLTITIEAGSDFKASNGYGGGHIRFTAHDATNRNRELANGAARIKVDAVTVPVRLRISDVRTDKNEFQPGDFINVFLKLVKARDADLQIPIPYAVELMGSGEIAAIFDDPVTHTRQELQGVIPAGSTEARLEFKGRIPLNTLVPGRNYTGSLCGRDPEGDKNPASVDFNVKIAEVKSDIDLSVDADKMLIAPGEKLILDGAIRNPGNSILHLDLKSRLMYCRNLSATVSAADGSPSSSLQISLRPGQTIPLKIMIDAQRDLVAENLSSNDANQSALTLTVMHEARTIEEKRILLLFDADRALRASGGTLTGRDRGTASPARILVKMYAYQNSPGPVEGLTDLLGPGRDIEVMPGQDVWIRYVVQNDLLSNWVFLKNRSSTVDEMLLMEEEPVMEEDPFGKLTTAQERAEARIDELNKSMMVIGMLPGNRVSGLINQIPMKYWGRFESLVAQSGTAQLSHGMGQIRDEYYHLKFNEYMNSLVANSKVPFLFPPSTHFKFIVHYKVPSWIEPGRHRLTLKVQYLDTRRNETLINAALAALNPNFKIGLEAARTLPAILEVYRKRYEDRGTVFSPSIEEYPYSEAEGSVTLIVKGSATSMAALSEIDRLLDDEKWKMARDKAQKLIDETSDKTIRSSSLLRLGKAYLGDASVPMNLVCAKDRFEEFLSSIQEHEELNEGRFLLGATFMKLGDYEEARTILESIRAGGDEGLAFRVRQNLDLLRRNADASAARLMESGKDLFQRRQFYDAASRFQMIHSNFPQNSRAPEALFMRGRCLEEAGNTADAVEQYKEVSALYPSSSWATSAAMKARQAANAVPASEQLLKQGDDALARGDHLTAELRFKEWINSNERNPALPSVLLRYAKALEGQGKYQEARTIYGEILLSHPLSKETARARLGIGDAFRSEASLEEAEKAYGDVTIMNRGTDEAREAEARLLELRKTLDASSLSGLKVSSIRIRDFGNDGRSLNNECLESNEAALAAITLSNSSRRPLENLTITPLVDQRSALIADLSPIALERIGAGDAIALPSQIALRSAAGAQPGKAFLKLRVSDASGNEVTLAAPVTLAAALPPAPAAPGVNQGTNWFLGLLQAGMQYYQMREAAKTYMETGNDPTGGQIDQYYRLLNRGVGRKEEMESDARWSREMDRQIEEQRSVQQSAASSTQSSTATANDNNSILTARLLTPTPVTIDPASERPVMIEIQLSTEGSRNFKGRYALFPQDAWGNGYNTNLYYDVSRGAPRVIKENLTPMLGNSQRSFSSASVRFFDEVGQTVQEVLIPITMFRPESIDISVECRPEVSGTNCMIKVWLSPHVPGLGHSTSLSLGVKATPEYLQSRLLGSGGRTEMYACENNGYRTANISLPSSGDHDAHYDFILHIAGGIEFTYNGKRYITNKFDGVVASVKAPSSRN